MGGPKRAKKENYVERRGRKKKKEEEEEPEEIVDLDEDEGVPGSAKKNIETVDTGVHEDEFGAKDYRNQLTLKPDCDNRPLWVGLKGDLILNWLVPKSSEQYFVHKMLKIDLIKKAPNGHIFLESFSPVYKHAHDFLIAISEPVCRPEHIQEHKLKACSLYAAVSVGLETDDIIEYLRRLSKTSIPDGIVEFIKLCALSYGKIKLVLKHNKYFIESPFPEVLHKLLKDPLIQECRLRRDTEALITEVESKTKAPQFGIKPVNPTAETPIQPEKAPVPDDITDFYSKMDKADEEDEEEQQTSTVSLTKKKLKLYKKGV